MTDYTVKPGDRIITTGPVTISVGAPPPPPIVYTFREQFLAPLDPAIWRSSFHVPDSLVKVFDQVAVKNGMLELVVQKMPDGTWHGGLVDTKVFTQLYGRFGVRCKVSQAKGGFPAPLWLYAKGTNPDGTSWENELDVCEILTNPPGTNSKGYSPYPYADVTLAHFHCIKNASRPGYRYHLPAGTFADGLHTFEMEWRKDHISWLVDGIERARVTDPALIPDHAMPLILDHAIGGSWAGPPDATTPDRSVLWIDEVWATA